MVTSSDMQSGRLFSILQSVSCHAMPCHATPRHFTTRHDSAFVLWSGALYKSVVHLHLHLRHVMSYDLTVQYLHSSFQSFNLICRCFNSRAFNLFVQSLIILIVLSYVCIHFSGSSEEIKWFDMHPPHRLVQANVDARFQDSASAIWQTILQISSDDRTEGGSNYSWTALSARWSADIISNQPVSDKNAVCHNIDVVSSRSWLSWQRYRIKSAISSNFMRLYI